MSDSSQKIRPCSALQARSDHNALPLQHLSLVLHFVCESRGSIWRHRAARQRWMPAFAGMTDARISLFSREGAVSALRSADTRARRARCAPSPGGRGRRGVFRGRSPAFRLHLENPLPTGEGRVRAFARPLPEPACARHARPHPDPLPEGEGEEECFEAVHLHSACIRQARPASGAGCPPAIESGLPGRAIYDPSWRAATTPRHGSHPT